MTDKAIVICVVLAALAVIAIVFVRRAMRYKKAIWVAEQGNEPIPKADVQPPLEIQPEPESESEPPLERLSAQQAYVDRYIFPERNKSKGGKTVQISLEHHARITAILNIVNRYGISMTRYLDGVLQAHFEDNAEIIKDMFGDLSDEPLNDKL
jgi:hypothetical protein